MNKTLIFADKYPEIMVDMKVILVSEHKDKSNFSITKFK